MPTIHSPQPTNIYELEDKKPNIHLACEKKCHILSTELLVFFFFFSFFVTPVPKLNVGPVGGRTLCKVDKRPHSLSAAKKQLVRLSGTKYRLKLDHMDKWDKILYP